METLALIESFVSLLCEAIQIVSIHTSIMIVVTLSLFTQISDVIFQVVFLSSMPYTLVMEAFRYDRICVSLMCFCGFECLYQP